MDAKVKEFALQEIARAQAALAPPRQTSGTGRSRRSPEHSIGYWLGVLATAHKLAALK